MYCTSCGHQLNIGGRYCSKCGHMTTLSTNYSEIAFKSSFENETECPKCGGSGRISISESSDGCGYTVASFGIFPLLNAMFSDGKMKCDKCNGEGVVSQ